LATNRLQATTDTAAAVADSDVVIVITPAVLTEERDADLSNLQSASRDIARGLRPGTLVIYETTVPVGTTRRALAPLLSESGLTMGTDFFVAYSPERVKSRIVMRHLNETPKVIGGFDETSASRASEFYSRYLGSPVIDVGSPEAAEFVKLAGMVQRDVSIALANQLANYAEDSGLDAKTLFEAANTDGECALLQPGIGVGGHCTPVYPYFVIQDAERRGLDASLVSRAREINDDQAERSIVRLERHLGTLNGKQVAILGLGFRPDVKEHICSPTFLVEAALRSRGAETRVHDPLYADDEITGHGFTPWGPGDDAWHPEAIVLVTGHTDFVDFDLAALRAKGLRTVVDGRRFWTPEAVADLGLHYIATGRSETLSVSRSSAKVA
jgi:nucleotide sugar dehydrogenase